MSLSSQPKRAYNLQELADIVGARVVGDPTVEIDGLGTLQTAGNAHLSFLANPAYEKYLAHTKAGAVLVNESALDLCPVNALVHENPYVAYAQLSRLWDYFGAKSIDSVSIHDSAVVHPTAEISDRVEIAEGAVIKAGAVIDSGVRIGPNCVVGEDVRLGADTSLYAGVILYHGVSVGQRCILHSGVVVGSDGFGFAPHKGSWEKIAQLGGVVIGDDVEIGANTAIDRGALDNTEIGNGVKLDNLIQIAHNVRIGENTAIAACSAIAGSTTIGKNCILGGASGVAGHLTIADGVHVTAMTMVIKSLTEPGVYSSGTGVQPNAKWRKSIARLRQLDNMAMRLKSLEKQVAAGSKPSEDSNN